MNAPERDAGRRRARFRLFRRGLRRRALAAQVRDSLRNGSFAILSVAVGLLVCEAALRLFHPRYEFAANPLPENPANSYELISHPDTGVAHRLIHNNLGGRQSRNFSAESLDRAVNIAFFGDSQTQNYALPAPYSFTEGLDYLLNVSGASSPVSQEPHQPRFNVLNFGMATYGAGQAYLAWRRTPVRRKLAHVFYMVVSNDLLDLRKSIGAGIVRLGDAGEILDGRRPHKPAWKRLLARLHLTYLAVDAWQRLVPPAGFSMPRETARPRDGGHLPREEAKPVFLELVRRWKREVEADGAAFHFVLLPNPMDGGGWLSGAGGGWVHALREDAALRGELGIFDLRECFEDAIPSYRYEDWSFANDPHWNSAANMLAAACLYRYLEGALGLPERTNEELAHMRYAYYQAFLDSLAWDGTRYMPAAAWARPGPEPASAGEAIVAKYLALELVSPEPSWLRDAYAAGALATSVWDVYAADAPKRRLVYVKSPCGASWRARGPDADGFFLHVVPLAPEQLPAEQLPFGFVNLDHMTFLYHRRSETECVFSVRLPDYPLSKVRTGRFRTAGEGADVVYDNLWSVEFSIPLARSVWTVYASADGGGLDYVKTPCRRADTEARFFLHVYPLRPADLPAAAPGYANLDFAWEGKGAMADGKCRVSAALPDFPIAFVRTGQYRGGILPRRLWNARIDFAEVERARRATAP